MENFIGSKKIDSLKWGNQGYYGYSEKGLYFFDESSGSLKFYNENFEESSKHIVEGDFCTIFPVEDRFIAFSFKNSTLQLLAKNNERYEVEAETTLPSSSLITGVVGLPEGGYGVLDKNFSLIRLFDEKLVELRTVGSRLGYFKNYSYIRRLGFELPEHFVKKGNLFLVSDSGNKRLVLLNENFEGIKAIILPEAPYKILYFDGDIGAVLDFDNTLMIFSIEEGYLKREVLPFAPDIYSLRSSEPQNPVIGSEEGKFYYLNFQLKNKSEIIKKGDSEFGELRFLMNGPSLEEAKNYAYKKGGYFIEEYLRSGGTVVGKEEETIDFLKMGIKNSFDFIDDKMESLFKGCHDFVVMHKSIPQSGDPEADHIVMSRIGSEVFFTVKKIRGNFDKIVAYRKFSEADPRLFSEIEVFMEEKFSDYWSRYREFKENIELSLKDLQEERLVRDISGFWILREMMRTAFGYKKIELDIFISTEYLLESLRNFYQTVALLFFDAGKTEQFCYFMEKEIEMYPEKESLFLNYITKLMQLKLFDKALLLFESKPVKNKQGMNHLISKIHKSKGNLEEGFKYLQKELELFPHRSELFVELIEYNRMTKEEVTLYLKKFIDESQNNIDENLNVAKAFKNVADFENMELFLDKELTFYPENENAKLMKIECLIDIEAPFEEIEILLESVKNSSNSIFLIKSKGHFYIQDYANSFDYFERFLQTAEHESKVKAQMHLFESLNYLPCNESLKVKLKQLQNTCKYSLVKYEMDTYFQFTEKSTLVKSFEDVSVFSKERYLASNSCYQLVIVYLCSEIEKLIDSNEFEKALKLSEMVLKFHPGSKQIFDLLEKLG